MSTGTHHHHDGATDGVARPVIELESTDVTVAAGQSVRVKVTLTNVGAVVETYQLSVLGPAAQYCSIVPAEVALFPGDQGSATLIIRPPASSSTVAGTYRVGILATSEVRRTVQAAAEISVTVPSFIRFRSTAPRGTVDFKGHTTVYLQLANEGNSTIDCSVEASDPDGILKIKPVVDKVTLKPTETTWIKTSVKGPLVLFGSSRTRSMNAEFNVVLDHFNDKVPESVPPQTDRLNLIQKPRFRIRLGLFGRLAILLVLVGLIATLVYSRIFAPHSAGTPGSPNVPQGFVAKVVDDSQIVFTWEPASGATGYEIFAVGAAGDPTPSASAAAAGGAASAAASAPASAAASARASAPASAAASASASGRSLSLAAPARAAGKKKPSPGASARASKKAKASASAKAKASASAKAKASASAKASATASASASPTPTRSSSPSPSGTGLPQVLTSAEASSLNTPVCINCTSVATVNGNTTRAVLQPLPKVSQACYRIVAKAGNYQSLFSVAQCIDLTVVQARQASASASASASAASASASAAMVHACPPVSTSATPSGPTSIALQWAAATAVPAGAKPGSCDPTMATTGYEIQRQILNGWSDLPSQPTANDTAFEATGLPQGVKQCFRIKALDANGGSAYTSPFCATLPVSAATSSASPSPSAP
jgi:hypothetical protein